MEKKNEILREVAAENPNVRFIMDNFDVLKMAHRGKAILVVDQAVVKVFNRVVDAFMYVDALAMDNVSYAIKECVEPIEKMLIWSNGK